MPMGQLVHSAVHSNYMEKQPQSLTPLLLDNRQKKVIIAEKAQRFLFVWVCFCFFFRKNKYVAAYCKSFDCKKLQHDVIMESSAPVILSIMNHLQRFPQKIMQSGTVELARHEIYNLNRPKTDSSNVVVFAVHRLKPIDRKLINDSLSWALLSWPLSLWQQ